MKKVFLRLRKNSKERTCGGVSFNKVAGLGQHYISILQFLANLVGKKTVK